MAALKNFKKSGYKYIILTNDENVDGYREIVTGDWRPINWRIMPFHFPEPVAVIEENQGRGRQLAVWESASLPL
jgi:hypothetical protein